MDVFKVPPTQCSIDKDQETDYRPIQSVTAGNPIQFDFSSAEDEYVNLFETYFHTQVKFTLIKDDGTAITSADWDYVLPANNLLHSMFSQIDIKINNQDITRQSSTYAYRAYLETLLGFSNSAKKSHLQNVGWYDDKKQRLELIKSSTNTSIIDLRGKLHLDLTYQERAILGRTMFSIRMVPHQPKFYLTVPDGINVTVELIDPRLDVHRSKITEQQLKGHQAALAVGTAKYPICRTEVIPFNLTKDYVDFMQDNLISGQIPRRCFVMFVSNDAFNGSLKEEPFQFENYNISYICMYVDGTMYPSRPYSPNFDKNLFAREHTALYQVLNQNGTDTYLQLSKKEFKTTNTIFAFNFAPDLSSGPGAAGHVNLIKRGSVRIHVKFNEPLRKAVKCLLFAEFDNMIEIDEMRNVMTDY